MEREDSNRFERSGQLDLLNDYPRKEKEEKNQSSSNWTQESTGQNTVLKATPRAERVYLWAHGRVKR